jgi:hypothetical protein
MIHSQQHWVPSSVRSSTENIPACVFCDTPFAGLGAIHHDGADATFAQSASAINLLRSRLLVNGAGIEHGSQTNNGVLISFRHWFIKGYFLIGYFIEPDKIENVRWIAP